MMIGIATRRQHIYDDISQFAQDIYAKRLKASISAIPDAFAYAEAGDKIIGCFGVYRARQRGTLTLETYISDVFERISGNDHVDRRSCAEIGTRAVAGGTGFRSTDISLALSASLLLYAKSHGLKYLGFTSNRTVCPLARILGVELIALGRPDLSRRDERFRKNWETFFRFEQFCFGFKIGPLDGCLATLERLEERGIHSGGLRKTLA